MMKSSMNHLSGIIKTRAQHAERKISHAKWQLRYALVQRALKKRPEHPGHLKKLARILTKLKDEKELLQATECYARTGFRHNNPNTAKALVCLAHARAVTLWENNRHDAALELINSIIGQKTPDTDLLYLSLYWQLCIAKTEHRKNIIDERLISKYLELEKQHLRHDFEKAHLAAEALTRLGRADEARKILLQHEDNPTAFFALSNTSIDDDALWLAYVNRFFSSRELEQLSLVEGADQRFLRLKSDQGTPCSGGPKISVIMTAFNVENYIETAIRSALAQSWSNFELLIVDDCSTDGTRSIVKKFMRHDSRIKLIENSENCGTYVNRNKAYDLATGEYVTCHDSDDWAHPRKLEHQITALLKNPDAVSSSSHWVRVHENGQFIFRMPGAFAQYNANSLMFKIDRVKPVLGYWDSVRISADSEFIKRLKAVFGKKRAIMLDDVLMFGLKRQASLTSAPETGHTPSGNSPLRKRYHDNYTNWHKTIDRNSAYMEFPLKNRPFEAPEEILAKGSCIEKIPQ